MKVFLEILFEPDKKYKGDLHRCLAIFLTSSAFAQFADTDPDKKSFAVGLTGQNENAVSSLTAIFPYEKIKGYAGIYAGRQTADGELVDENIVGRLQGGGDIGDVRLRAYTEATRNLYKAIDLEY